MDSLLTFLGLAIVAWVLISPLIILRLIRKQNPQEKDSDPALLKTPIPDDTVPVPIIKNQALSDFELLTKIRSLSPRSFEYYTAEVFKHLGYKVQVTRQHHDNGIDIILHQGGTVSFVQCKKYIDKSVTVGEIRDFYGATVDKLTGGTAFFVTTNIFTKEAITFVNTSKNRDQFKLIDGQRLINCIRLVERNNQPIAFKNFDNFKALGCPSCTSGRLLKRQNKSNGNIFYGCSNFPTCKYARSI